MRRCPLFLILALVSTAAPALADVISINVELTVTFFPPDNFPANAQFVGAASFYLDIAGGNGPQPVD